MKKKFLIVFMALALIVVMASPPNALGSNTAADESTVTAKSYVTPMNLTTMPNMYLANVVSQEGIAIMFTAEDSCLASSTIDKEIVSAIVLAPVVNKEDYAIKKAEGESFATTLTTLVITAETISNLTCTKSDQKQEYVNEGTVTENGGTINSPPVTSFSFMNSNFSPIADIMRTDQFQVLKHPTISAVNYQTTNFA